MQKLMIRAAMLPALALTAIAMPGMETEAKAATQSRLCTIDHVAVIDNRIHVKCIPIANKAYTKDIPYYAMLLTQPRVKIEAIIKMAIESKRNKKPARIWFDPSDYKSVPGCAGSNCRKLKGLALE